MRPTNNDAPVAKKRPNEAVAAVLLAASVLILAFFTYDQYYRLTAERSAVREVLGEKSRLEGELQALKGLQVRSKTPAMAADIERYAAPYREDAVLSSLFPSESGNYVVSVGMAKGQKLPIGLSSTEISLNVRADDRASFLAYLERLTSKDAKKRYFVKRASFPFDTRKYAGEPFNANVTLGLYYLPSK